MTLKDKIKQKALELGFDAVGITTAEPLEPRNVMRYEEWLRCGNAGEMSYLSRNFDKRINPAQLLTNAKSLICLAYSYKTTRKEQRDKGELKGRIASYALFPDYHKHLKSKLFELASFISDSTQKDVKFKPCVDSVPLAEKCFAQRAGLGYIGKNTLLINDELGSEFFLAELITTLEIEPDSPAGGDCRDCNICIENCPTNALSADGVLDARKCINYLTIEYKGDIDDVVGQGIGENIYGCDKCIQVCPKRKASNSIGKKDFQADHSKEFLDINEVLNWDKQEYVAKIKGSAMERLSLDNFKRNAKICFSNISNENADQG